MSFCPQGLAPLLSGTVAAAFVALVPLPPASAETRACPDLDVTVTADDPALANRICDVAATALDRLSRCALHQTMTFEIQVSRALPSGFEGCFGIYHCADDTVEVLQPSALVRVVQDTGDFAQVPNDVLFDSLIVHEISHVLIDQSGLSTPRTAAEIEYIAYAMQMDSLPATARDLLLQAHPVDVPVPITGLNDIILSFAPEVFAVKAWTHFTTPENGCGFVQRVLDRSVHFPSDIR